MGYDYGRMIQAARKSHAAQPAPPVVSTMTAQEKRLAEWNAATQAKSPYPSLKPEDFLLPGDSLENYHPGVTDAEISQWYLTNQSVVWLAADGKQTTVLPEGDAAEGYTRTGLTAFTLPNGQQIIVSSGQQRDVYDVGGTHPEAFIPSVAASVYAQAGIGGK